MEKDSILRIVEASGPPYQLGYEIGRECQDLAGKMVEDCQREAREKYKLTWDQVVAITRKYLAYSEEAYPRYVEEIRGYAEGAGFTLEDIFALFCSYSSEKDTSFGCTDVVISERLSCEGHLLMAHNEDFYPKDAQYLTLLRGSPEGEPSFLCMAYGGIIFNAGLSSVGLGFGGNALSPNDSRVGVPVDLVFRSMYGAKNIVEAITYANCPQREASYNNIVASKEGEIFSVEGSATDFDILYGGGSFLVHTNHYLSHKMQRYESVPQTFSTLRGQSCSIARFYRAERLLKEAEEISMDILKGILADHANYPDSICRHHRAEDPESVKTVFSSIVDLTESALWICLGNPCQGQYSKYTL